MNGTVVTWNRVLYPKVKEYRRRRFKVIKINNPETNKGTFIVPVKLIERPGWKGCGGRIGNSWNGIKLTNPPYSDQLHYVRNKPWDEPIIASEIPTQWLYWLGAANRSMGLNLPSMFPNASKRVYSGVSMEEQLFVPDIELPVPLL